jgi:hypothetical protein
MHTELRKDPGRVPDTGRELANFKPSSLIDPAKASDVPADARKADLDAHRYLFYAGLAVLTEVYGRNFQDPSVSLVSVDRNLESKLKREPRPVGRFRTVAEVTTQRASNLVDKMFDMFPQYEGYKFVVDRVNDYLPAFQELRPNQRYQDLPTLFRAGVNSSVWAAANFAEVYARKLFVNGNFTQAELPTPSLSEMRSGVAQSSVLRNLAALRSATFNDALTLLAGCNDGCKSQDSQGQVPEGVPKPTHLVKSWHTPYQKIEDFVGAHATEAPSQHQWFDVSQTPNGVLVAEAPRLFAEVSRLEAERIAANPQQWDQVGCPVLFHGMARKIGETIADMATHETLWPNEIDAMRSGKDLDWGTMYL